MRFFFSLCAGLGLVFGGMGCGTAPGAFEQDVAFLREHVEVIVLEAPDRSARAAVVPAYQGRVMTSTIGAAGGPSFGWINYDLVAQGYVSKEEAQGTLLEHVYLFGGEDRLWFGPEAGPYSLFFAPGQPAEFAYWRTPALIDTEPYDAVEKTRHACTFRKAATLTNAMGTTFDLELERTVRMLDADAIAQRLQMDLPRGVRYAGFETVNTVTNTGRNAWEKETGLLSIWILGMYKHSETTTVAVPFHPGPEEELGPKVKDDYFGAVPAERLIVDEDVLFFRADGQYRSKIGVSALRATPYCGSYDAESGRLTIVWYNQPDEVVAYVNSSWADQTEPYKGSVINAYNDGPIGPGEPPLGPFYELETSSPAAQLAPQQSLRHVHATMHFMGACDDLDRLSRAVLGVSLETIKAAF